MSTGVFSVLMGHAAKPTELASYVRRLKRVEQGIEDLLAPIRLSSDIRLFRRVEPEGEEWLDVHVEEGAQRSMVPELERSLGSMLRDLDIEGALAQQRVRLALALLTELQTKRQWNTGEFLDVVERGTLTRAGRHMGDDQGRLMVRTPDGQSSSTLLPNRRFSALRASAIDLQFRPLKVGIDGAQVWLSKATHRLVTSRSRRIELNWHGDVSSTFADELFHAAKVQHWVWARCRVIDNRDGIAKTLLVESMHSLNPS
ncbi:MAG: hypothetical protein Q8K91_00605 [Hylemonella sp.]|nr:hypothetical protein [Hylemonella sp.]MDP1935685.1 hypothetical protein [Hylemonella sp.]